MLAGSEENVKLSDICVTFSGHTIYVICHAVNMNEKATSSFPLPHDAAEVYLTEKRRTTRTLAQ